MDRRLYRLTLLVMLALLVLGGAGLSQAQDDAHARILDAYRAVEEWQSYRVQLDETSDYAMTAQGQQVATWQRRERDLVLNGQYDVTDQENALIVLDVRSRVSGSTEEGGTQTPTAWDVDLSVVRMDDATFWQGQLDAEPDEAFSLPETWSPLAHAEADEVPALADLRLSRYLLEDGAEPFLIDAEAWLGAAESIEGPRSFNVTRTTTGDLYVATLNPADVPELFEGRFPALTEGQSALVGGEDLLQQLAETGTVLWGAALDPETSALLAQFIQIDVEAEVGSSLLQSPYGTMSLAFSSNQTVVFSKINEQVSLPGDLPQP